MKKIFVLTGEPSGDKLASTVISKLKQNNSDIEYSCVGGEHLNSLDIKSIYDLKEITYIGFTSVLMNLFKIKKKIFVKTNEINQSNLKKNLKFLLKYKNNLESIVFSSVAPKIYKKFSIFFKSNLNKKIIEIF